MAPPRTSAPCGTRGAYFRHRRRREPLDPACRAVGRDYDAARRADAARSKREKRSRSVSHQVVALVELANRNRSRETRMVRMPSGKTFALGAFAGTGIPHPFVPDGGTSTMCQLCFGWCSDYRHTSTVWVAP